MLRAFYSDLALHSITISPVQTKSSLLWRLLARRILDRSFFILSKEVFDPVFPRQHMREELSPSPIEPHSKSFAPPHDQKCGSPTANGESIPTPASITITPTDMNKNKISTKAELEHDLGITGSFGRRDAAIPPICYSPVISL
jgi:hypothetical protein